MLYLIGRLQFSGLALFGIDTLLLGAQAILRMFHFIQK